MALNFRKFIEGLRIVPKAASTASEKGDLDVVSGSGKLNYHNGTSASPVVTEDHSATLTNKTIDADQNTLSNIEDADIKVGANIARSKLASGTASSVVVNNVSGVLSDLSLTSAQIILGNASNIPTATSVTGEVTISNTGVTTVGTVANSVISGLLQTQMESLAVASTITVSKSFVRLNSGSGTIDGVTAGSNGQHLILTNLTGAAVIIQNQSGSATAANRILTGTGGAVSLDNNASLFLIYNSSDSRWYVIGGVGGSSSFNAVAGESLSINDVVYISNGSGSDVGRTAGRVYKLDAKNDDRVEFLGVCLDAAASAGDLIRIQVGGKVSGFSGLSIGKPVFASVAVSGNEGAIQITAPIAANQWVVPVGIAASTTELIINSAGSATAVKITSEVVDNLYADVIKPSSNTILTNANSVVLATGGAGGITITLPSPAVGKIFNIKKIDAGVGVITIQTPSGQTIDAFTSAIIGSQYESLTITSDGTNFFII